VHLDLATIEASLGTPSPAEWEKGAPRAGRRGRGIKRIPERAVREGIALPRSSDPPDGSQALSELERATVLEPIRPHRRGVIRERAAHRSLGVGKAIDRILIVLRQHR